MWNLTWWWESKKEEKNTNWTLWSEYFSLIFNFVFSKRHFWAIKKYIYGKHLSLLLCAWSRQKKTERNITISSSVFTTLLHIFFSVEDINGHMFTFFLASPFISYFEVYWCQLVEDLLLTALAQSEEEKGEEKAKVALLLYWYYARAFWLDWSLINNKCIFHLKSYTRSLWFGCNGRSAIILDSQCSRVEILAAF